MKRALLILLCLSCLRPAHSRMRCVPPISNCGKPPQRLTTRYGKSRVRERTCVSDSMLNFRQVAPTSPCREVRWPTPPLPNVGP